MLVKVSVENFKSFDKAAELTMISSNKIRTNANHRLKIKSTQLLKYAVVYGANASGKTNLALFFKFFKDSVCNGIPIEATQMFCKNRKENKERESSFEIQITVGDKFYAYGFSAVLSIFTRRILIAAYCTANHLDMYIFSNLKGDSFLRNFRNSATDATNSNHLVTLFKIIKQILTLFLLLLLRSPKHKVENATH